MTRQERKKSCQVKNPTLRYVEGGELPHSKHLSRPLPSDVDSVDVLFNFPQLGWLVEMTNNSYADKEKLQGKIFFLKKLAAAGKLSAAAVMWVK